MTPEELYKKEFGDADSIPKESVIRLLQHFAAALKIERQQVKKLDLTLVTKCALPERKPSVCRHCKSDDIYFDMDAGTWVCNECNEKAN